MENETKVNKVKLQHYLEALMAQYKEAHTRIHELEAAGVERAREAIEIRLEGMNEFRAQILTERGTFLTKDKFDASHGALSRIVDAKVEACEKRIVILETAVANLRGRTAAVSASIGIGLVILELILKFAIK